MEESRILTEEEMNKIVLYLIANESSMSETERDRYIALVRNWLIGRLSE